MDSERVWELAWKVWKVILLILGVIAAIGVLTVYFGDFLIPLVLIIVAAITIFLYRKVAQDVRNR